MCRLLLMTGLVNPELTTKFMKAAKEPMSWGNNMGIGFTAVKEDGEFFTERWHNNEQFFDRESPMTYEVMEQLKPFKSRLPKLAVNYSLYGTPDFNTVSSVTMHTRYATCGKEFENTHPFVDGDTSLVHNGVIDNAFDLGLNKISTCDSEAALQSYIQHDVGRNIENTQAWLDSLSGYWAFGIFSRDSSGRRILDIVRNNASLYVSNIEGFGVVIATTADIITSAARACGLTAPTPQMVKQNVLWRFDAVTGLCIDKLEVADSALNFKPRWTMQDTGEWERITGQKKSKTVQEPIIPTKESDSPTEYKGCELPSEFPTVDAFFDYLEDTKEPLVDRLYAYSEYLFAGEDTIDSNFGYMFECLPVDFKDTTWQYDDFFDTVAEVELAYQFYTKGAKEMN